MRSGTCTNLKFSTNVSVPFLIYAVMLSLRVFSSKFQSEQGFLFFFVGRHKYFETFSCVSSIYDIYLHT